MNHLQINIALAEALGWVETYTRFMYFSDMPNGSFVIIRGEIFCKDIESFKKKFDYRDPAVFVAICKHWGLHINHVALTATIVWADDTTGYTRKSKADSIEKAAALCVLDFVKLGIDKHAKRTS